MRKVLTSDESSLLAVVAALVAVAVLGPAMAHGGHHGFADQRTLWGVSCAMDVLTNVPFALAGLLGAWRLSRLPRGALSDGERAMAALFFAGLAATAAGSSWYHLQPDDAGLAIDRGAMAVAFAGALGLAGARISVRAGRALGWASVVLAPLAVAAWAHTGNVLPWALAQFGGMALLLWLATRRPAHAVLPVRWIAVLLAYGAAKLLELGDQALFEMTGQLLSGHSLKHVVAAAAAWPVLAAVRPVVPSGQNAPRFWLAR